MADRIILHITVSAADVLMLMSAEMKASDSHEMIEISNVLTKPKGTKDLLSVFG